MSRHARLVKSIGGRTAELPTSSPHPSGTAFAFIRPTRTLVNNYTRAAPISTSSMSPACFYLLCDLMHEPPAMDMLPLGMNDKFGLPSDMLWHDELQKEFDLNLCDITTMNVQHGSLLPLRPGRLLAFGLNEDEAEEVKQRIDPSTLGAHIIVRPIRNYSVFGVAMRSYPPHMKQKIERLLNLSLDTIELPCMVYHNAPLELSSELMRHLEACGAEVRVALREPMQHEEYVKGYSVYLTNVLQITPELIRFVDHLLPCTQPLCEWVKIY